MKKLLVLILTLSLLLGALVSCAEDVPPIEDLNAEASSQTSAETSAATTSEETTTEITEPESETTSADTSDTRDTTTKTTEAEESETEGSFSYEPIYVHFSSYEDFEKALNGENVDGYNELKHMYLYDVPQAEKLADIIKKEGKLQKPLLNGVPVQVKAAGIDSGTYMTDPSVNYVFHSDDNQFTEIKIYYVNDFHNKDFSYESLRDITKAIGTNLSNDWEEKNLKIGGENITVLEKNIDVKTPWIRFLYYYKDGLLIMLWTNDRDNMLTDEFLQSFSVGYVAPTNTLADNQN